MIRIAITAEAYAAVARTLALETGGLRTAASA
jgi:hypothetical protein